MSVQQMPRHYWSVDDVVPVFGEAGYEGKGRIARRLTADDRYLIDWGDGTTSERIIPCDATRRYLDMKRRVAG